MKREGHKGVRASLDRGADTVRGRAAALARRGSGAVAPSALAGGLCPKVQLRLHKSLGVVVAGPVRRGSGVVVPSALQVCIAVASQASGGIITARAARTMAGGRYGMSSRHRNCRNLV